jgi:hypothetical protein
MTIKRFLFERLHGRVLVVLTASLVSLQPAALGQAASGTGAGAGATDLHRAMLRTLLLSCHTPRLKTGGLALDRMDLAAAGALDAHP